MCTLLDGSTDTVTVLHITGIVGPRKNGDAYTAGQCYDTLRQGVANEGWTADTLGKFLDIWQRWHLNDMNPCCEHQREWDGEKTVTLYEYKMNDEMIRSRSTLTDIVRRHLLNGESVQLTPEGRRLYKGTYFLKTYDSNTPDGYKLSKTYQRHARELYPLDSDSKYGYKHPDGILAKPCPVCGYKWGTSWRAERIPAEVLTWLETLPDSKRTPAWV